MKYYQQFNEKIGRFLKIDSETGLIMSVSEEEFKNIPYTPQKVEKRKGFYELFG